MDPCNDRMSFPTCLYIRDVLALLSSRTGAPQSRVLRFIGSAASMFAFRRQVKVHACLLLVGLALLAVAYVLWEDVFKVVLGALLVEVINIVREALTWWWGERRSEET